jgi:hypothetical protein
MHQAAVGSESLWQACLPERVVRPMARPDEAVHHEASFVDWALPDFVIALPLADKGAAVLD